jgi:Protein of unknown function (DUF3995)
VIPDRRLRALAGAAAVLAFGSALVSAYWTAGGTALLDTVGGALERLAREPGAAGVALGATTVLLKVAGGLLALALLRRSVPRLVEWVALVAGAGLALYGGALVAVGALALTGALGEPADPRALRWHVLVWDPWFLVWGVLLVLAVRRRRSVGGRV